MTVNEIKVKVTEYVKDHKPVVIGVLVVLGVGIILLGVISALGGTGNSSNNTPPVTTPIVVPPSDTPIDGGNSSQKVINMWGAFFSPEVMAPVIAQYENENPNIKINYTNEVIRNSDINGYRSKLDNIVGSQTVTTAPDIFIVDSGWTGSFASKSAPAEA